MAQRAHEKMPWKESAGSNLETLLSCLGAGQLWGKERQMGGSFPGKQKINALLK
jgi:hypothetical protein